MIYFKKYIAKAIFGGLLLSVTSGCNNMLDLKPLDQITDASYWKSAGDFKLAANEFYTYLATFQPMLSTGPHADINSDLVTGSISRNNVSNGSYTLYTSSSAWTDNYTHIRSINYLLDKAANYASADEIKNYVAEAKFFRGYSYFDLLQNFGGVPIISTTLDPSSPETYAARNSRDEVVDFIISDLEAAIAVLPLASAIPAEDKGRVSKEAAQAFLARVALYEGTWNKSRANTSRANALLDIAITYAQSVMSGGQFSIFQPTALGDSAYKYMFILEDEKSNPASIGKAGNKEYILVNRYSTTLRPITGFNITKFSFDNSLLPTRKLANMYLCSDGLPVDKSPLFQGYALAKSEYQNRDNRMWNSLCIHGKPYWDNSNYRKTWLGDSLDLSNARTKSFNAAHGDGYHIIKWASERQVADYYEGYDYPVIRYAEVLLIYAEAKFERDEAISDADLDISLNLVRQRINKFMPKLSNGLVVANGLDMRTEIRRERTIEFLQEGFRFDDLKRWKTAEIEMPMALLGVKWTGTEYETSLWKTNKSAKDADGVIIVEDVSTRQFLQKHYLYPIPTQQIQLNPNLAQNPDW